jgi:hypothetical protein
MLKVIIAFFLWYWRDICEEFAAPWDRLEHPGNPSPAHNTQKPVNFRLNKQCPRRKLPSMHTNYEELLR